MTTTRIIVGDARTALQQLEANSVHCIVTTPPHFHTIVSFFQHCPALPDTVQASPLDTEYTHLALACGSLVSSFEMLPAAHVSERERCRMSTLSLHRQKTPRADQVASVQ
jgi:hypothetical protein